MSTSQITKVDVVPNTRSTENIYYYAFFQNTTTQDVPAYYVENRTQPVLNKISDYKMSVLSIDFSDLNIPYFISNEIDLSFRLFYQPDNLIATATLFSGGPVPIVSYQQLINEYNTQLLNVFNNLILQYDAIYGIGAWVGNVLLPQVPPGITFDSVNNLFTLWVDNRMSQISNTVYWTSAIQFARLFQGVDAIENVGAIGTQFVFQNTYLNNNNVVIGGITYINNIQQYPSGSNWSLIAEIVLISRGITCRKEYIGYSENNSKAVITSVIDNYAINIDNKFTFPSTRFVVRNLSSTPRYIDLFGDNALYQLDFALYYVTSTGRYDLATVKPSQSFGVKVMFVKQVF